MRIQALITATVVAFAAMPTVVSGQTPSGVTFGTLIGANIATISDADKGFGEVVGAAFDKKKRIGLKAGVFLKIPLAGMLSLQPELHYAQSGVRIESAAGNVASFDVDLGYVEVPVLLRLDVGGSSAIHPMLLVGASGARRVQCNFSLTTASTSIEQQCDADGATADELKKSDYSVVGGAGLAGNLGGRTISLQLRYSLGLASIASENTDGVKPKNRALAVLLGLGF